MKTGTTRRVVITGIGVVSALGDSRRELFSALRQNKSAVRAVTEWQDCEGLRTRLAAPLPQKPDMGSYSQKLLRSTGGVAQYALVATTRALEDAKFEDASEFDAGRIGVAYGSGFGSNDGIAECAKFITARSTRGLASGIYHKIMAHTCATHISMCFGVRGRLICTSTACTSGSQAIGYGYEAIQSGVQDAMICGGAEELSLPIAAMFDVLCACSVNNAHPDSALRPFDKQRDGMVVGEGACTVFLEELSHARARGAEILAEVTGFSTNCDAFHITNPHTPTIIRCFQEALEKSGTLRKDIGYIKAHAPGTRSGDSAESEAMREVYGERVPVSSLKGHLGHSLGACGALELAAAVEVLRESWIPPTRNLQEVDPECDGLMHVTGEGLSQPVSTAIVNTVAFGGVNTSLVLRRYDE